MTPSDQEAERVRQANALTGSGRAGEALTLTAPLVAAPDASAALLGAHAAALKGLGRHEEAEPFNARAVAREPDNRFAWYNHAATLGDLGRAAEAEAAVRRAIALGLDRPEAQLVLGRALTAQHRLDEGQATFEAILARLPTYADAHRDLAQLLWMRTGDAEAATARLDQALVAAPGDVPLIRTRAMVLQFAGDLAGAATTLEAGIARQPHPVLQLELANLRVEMGQGAAALALAEQAARAAPGVKPVMEGLAQASLAAGRPDQAAQVAAVLRQRYPDDQMAVLLQDTAWRMLGDARADELSDPARFVRAWRLPTPEGWADLDGFLADLAEALRRLHGFKAHPLQQSLRGGTQAQNLLASDEPAIQAFFRSVEQVLADHVAWLGQGADPLRARNTGAARIKTAWSVLLRPDGFHVNHFHPEGWLSSAFYVETPAEAVDDGDRSGWLKFGEPAYPTVPPLAPTHYVRPEPGTLVLFPSYLWHGTVPFTTDERRMSIAFDVVPA